MLGFAFQNLLSRPTRSILALLGLTVAIMGMVGLFSIAYGIEAMVNGTFQRIPGLLAMQPGAPIPLFSRIPRSWADEMREIPGVRIVRPELWVRAQLINGRPTFSPPRFLFGTDIDQTLRLTKAVYRDDIIEGRFLTADDKGTRNVVISKQVAEEFQKGLGDELRIDGNDVTIVGIYHCGSLLLDVAIVVDQSALRQMAHLEDNFLSSAYIESVPGEPEDALKKRLRDHFRGRGIAAWNVSQARSTPVLNIPGGPLVQNFVARFLAAAEAASVPAATPAEEADPQNPTEDAIEIRSAAEWGEKIQQFSADLDIFLYLMTGIGVVIALLSILNTMLMSVSERLTEFGVLKANGWSRGDVLRLIVWESALLGFCGGIAGCLLGWCGTHIVNWNYPTKLALYASPQLLILSLIFSTFLGVLGGAYPAWWAVKFSPMEAIRRGSL